MNTSEGRQVPYGSVYSIWVPTFKGGDENYKNLQNSVFVGSETVSDSGTPGEFLVGIKISKVFGVKTNITIGEEFPEWHGGMIGGCGREEVHQREQVDGRRDTIYVGTVCVAVVTFVATPTREVKW